MNTFAEYAAPVVCALPTVLLLLVELATKPKRDTEEDQ